MTRSRSFPARIALLAALACAPTVHAAVVFSGSGPTATTALDSFRSAIGAANERRIGWDGVKLDGTDVNPNTKIITPNTTVEIPIDRFKGVGAIFADPYAVSSDDFATVNPATAGEFPAFTPANTFVMFDATPGQFDDRFIEQTFVLAGTDTAAATRGFGAIFVDVEQAGSSSIEYFGQDANGNSVSLGTFDVPVGASGEPQFLGVLFDAPIVTEVQLTVGTNALFSFDGTNFQSFGAENLAQGVDLAVTDDFIFSDPELAQAVVPEPRTLTLLGALAIAPFLIATLRNRRRRA